MSIIKYISFCCRAIWNSRKSSIVPNFSSTTRKSSTAYPPSLSPSGLLNKGIRCRKFTPSFSKYGILAGKSVILPAKRSTYKLIPTKSWLKNQFSSFFAFASSRFFSSGLRSVYAWKMVWIKSVNKGLSP